jgi:hypothetical protein
MICCGLCAGPLRLSIAHGERKWWRNSSATLKRREDRSGRYCKQSFRRSQGMLVWSLLCPHSDLYSLMLYLGCSGTWAWASGSKTIKTIWVLTNAVIAWLRSTKHTRRRSGMCYVMCRFALYQTSYIVLHTAHRMSCTIPALLVPIHVCPQIYR